MKTKESRKSGLFRALWKKHSRSSGRAHMPFLRRITRRQFFLYQYVLAALAGIGVIALEFAPTNPMQFLEGDMVISHTCGNTVR